MFLSIVVSIFVRVLCCSFQEFVIFVKVSLVVYFSSLFILFKVFYWFYNVCVFVTVRLIVCLLWFLIVFRSMFSAGFILFF